MDSFFTLAMLILFGLSIFTLARADQWSRGAALGLVAGMAAIPILTIYALLQTNILAFVIQILIGLFGVALMVILFALAKSVAGRVGAAGRTRD